MFFASTRRFLILFFGGLFWNLFDAKSFTGFTFCGRKCLLVLREQLGEFSGESLKAELFFSGGAVHFSNKG